MALPVHQIMAQLQEGVDAKGAEAEEKGDKAVDDEAEAEEKGDKAVDDEAEKMIAEAEDRVAKSWASSTGDLRDSRCRALLPNREIFVRVQSFRRVPPVLPCNFCHPATSF